jgi:predicted amidohydrolase YtcJ
MSDAVSVVRNARIDGVLSDIRVSDGVIVEIGTALAPAGGTVIDVEGAHVIPGLWDEHVHFSQWSLNRSRLDVSAAASAKETAALVGAAIGDAPDLVGYGFRDGLWPDAPNLADLDAAAGNRPVVLLSGDLHCAWLNSAALAFHGFSSDSGLVREEPAFEVARRVADVPHEVLDRFALAAGREAASRGVVGFVDLEMGWNLDTWTRRRAGGFDSQRVEFGIYRQHLDRAIGLGFHTGMVIDDLVSVGRFKVLTDGSLNTRTAWCHEPYPGTTERGLLEVPADELVPLMAQAWAAGIEPAVHAIGDAANTLALDAFETVGARGRIEHAQLVAATDFARFARLGVVASVQPEHAMDDRDVADHFWADRIERAYAWKRLLDAGATLAFGSDAPVAQLDPWVTMAAAVGRDRDDRSPWHPDQRLTAEQAITASTRSRVAVGEPADLVVVAQHPADVTSAELRALPVELTMLAGRVTHHA